MSARIVVADDHPLIRAAIRSGVEKEWPGHEVVEVADAAAARAELARGGVALLTLDLQMEDSKGLETLLALRQDFPAVPIVVISASEEARIIRGARELGAAGFIRKSASMAQIRAALAAVRDGDEAFPPDAGDEAAAAIDDPITRLARLTPAQRRILMLVAQGKLNKQIAHEMTISEATVKAHMTAIFRRLGVTNRTQAVLLVGSLEAGNRDPSQA